MKWAIAQGWRLDNPADAIAQALPKHDKQVKHRRALPYSQVSDCISAVRQSRAGETTKLAFEFMVLTASRPGETRKAEKFEFNLDKAEWAIPAERMKAKRPHRVPLSPRAVEIVEAASALGDGSELVFPGARKGRPLSENTFRKLANELGFDVDAHGFRSSFRVWTQERTNVAREVAEAALAHSIKDKSEAAYARSEIFEKRRQLMDAWANFLSEEMSSVSRIA